MNIVEAISGDVKNELNHIYTEPRHNAFGGVDLGWFCREHAIHLYVLARLLGKDSSIAIGDFFLKLPNEQVFTSMKDDSDHSWCIIDGIMPVDLSITTKFLSKGEHDIGLIYGTNKPTIGGYSVFYYVKENNEEILKKTIDNEKFIVYNEKEKKEFDPVSLLEAPFIFLFPPPLGCRTFTEIHGDDVFFRITWHCYRLILGEARPFYRYRDPKQAVKGIVKFNKEAKKEYRKYWSKKRNFGEKKHVT